MTTNVLTQVAEAKEFFTSANAEYIAAIRAAHEAGHTYRAIADCAGISHTRVGQIVKPAPFSSRFFTGTLNEYSRLHRKVARERGRPERCERCERTDSATIYEWANLTGVYTDPADYARMCRPCHRAYDKGRH